MKKMVKTLTLITVLMSLSACGIFGGDDKESPERFEVKATALGVNGYLWQGTLDTLSFMPIEQADQNSGVIITGWHSVAASPNERVRVTVQFLSRTLRSDGLKVAVVRQALKDGMWIAAPVQAATALQIEEAILQQARLLRARPVE